MIQLPSSVICDIELSSSEKRDLRKTKKWICAAKSENMDTKMNDITQEM